MSDTQGIVLGTLFFTFLAVIVLYCIVSW